MQLIQVGNLLCLGYLQTQFEFRQYCYNFVREQVKDRKEVEQIDFELEDEIRREQLNIDIKDRDEINSVLLRKKDEELNSEQQTVKLHN